MTLPPPPDPQSDWAWFLDVDGTLVEIAATPEAVAIPLGLPGLLARLSRRCGGALALVSGRRVEDILRLMAPFRPLAAGLHGAERLTATGELIRLSPPPGLDDIRRRLAAVAARHPGVLLEDKGLALALHYRQAPDCREACRKTAEEAVAATPGFRLLPGKMVFEIKPEGVNKGAAIRAFMAEPPFAGRLPVFVGDDLTDEYGFQAVNALGGLGVVVGSPPETHARSRLDGVAAVRAWLERAAGP